MTEIRFDRHELDTYVQRGADEAGLFITLRSGVKGMTESEAEQRPLDVALRFTQPADLLDLAKDCLDLAAAGYRAMDENRLADGAMALLKTWPLAKSSMEHSKTPELP